ncbi:Xanthine and CO dehydrogenases maturation factor, XdhC/CoxF family [Lachnospiraceae bacterium TWA4]|nr:Xanthine and CO dehydrogenases maturation factor, XdhC/CoxF family [Lachnospiraceae bacterium TWA4]
MNFVEAMNQIESEKRILTVLDHEQEKLIISDEKIIWKNKETTFISEYQRELCKLTGTGLYNVGDYQVFCDTQANEKRLVICGGGHVGISVLKLAKFLGFYVVLIEDRPKFADTARKEGADEVLCDSFEHGLEGISSNYDTYFVIVTRGHRFDAGCVSKILNKHYAYIGMMGSKKRVATIKNQLLEEGYAPEKVNTVYTPIGIDIHSESPEEVAVSILAQVISVKNAVSRSYGYPRELLDAMTSSDEKKVLTTIISRKGSAPRGAGTKMLVLESGQCAGTIGGGCLESMVTSKAREMMFNEDEKFLVCTFDTTANLEDESMVCGGILEVLLERI